MPNPGTRSPQPVSMAKESATATKLGSDATVAAAQGRSPDASQILSEGADAAVLVLRDYYAAINARDFVKAYLQWSNGGGTSGQSPQQFADGYATTAGVSVVLGEPGPVEGAAGSRYIEIPATLDANQGDGSVRHYTGAFTLRMSVVDGASEAERGWHIASASLHEIRP
jgi:hypothetical protein